MKKILGLAALFTLSASCIEAKTVLSKDKDEQERTYVDFAFRLNKEDNSDFRAIITEFCTKYLYRVYMDSGRDMNMQMLEGLSVQLLEMLGMEHNDANVEKVVAMLRVIVDRYDAHYHKKA